MGPPLIRFLYSIAAAITAAAFADPLIEYTSNHGFFGNGVFTDHSNLDVVPALAIGCALVIALALLRARAAVLRIAGAAITQAQALRLLPYTFAVQLVALFAMETIEQYVVYGYSLGGTVWLGGPPAMSLVAHAIACIVVSIVGARVLRSMAGTVLRIVRIFKSFVFVSARPASLVRSSRAFIIIARPIPIRNRIGERAPPLLIR